MTKTPRERAVTMASELASSGRCTQREACAAALRAVPELPLSVDQLKALAFGGVRWHGFGGGGRAMTRIPEQVVHGRTQSFSSIDFYTTIPRCAMIRSEAHVESAERRDARLPADPWDPWPEQRIGYDTPAPASLFLPPRHALDRLCAYLERVIEVAATPTSLRGYVAVPVDDFAAVIDAGQDF
jgi:hypothetical protein